MDEPPRELLRMHWPSFLVGLVIMVAGSIYPFMFAKSDGRADHALAGALFWAMSAGFVRGIGFLPRHRLVRWLFSGWACAAGLSLAAMVWLSQGHAH